MPLERAVAPGAFPARYGDFGVGLVARRLADHAPPERRRGRETRHRRVGVLAVLPFGRRAPRAALELRAGEPLREVAPVVREWAGTVVRAGGDGVRARREQLVARLARDPERVRRAPLDDQQQPRG